ncbi:MAG: hypothetical protein K2M17_01080 [Bacilli bacterium]|nr:hypothetical protein [Bacilli bacterium]
MKTVLKKSLIVAVISVLALSVVLLCACNNSDTENTDDIDSIETYNAVLYDDVIGFAKEEFKAKHSDEFDIADMGNSFAIVGHEYTYIVNTKEELDSMFEGFPEEVDFDTQMICVYVWCCTKGGDFKLDKIAVNNNELGVQYSLKVKPVPGAVSMAEPHLRYMALVLNRIEIDSVKFTEG